MGIDETSTTVAFILGNLQTDYRLASSDSGTMLYSASPCS
jgi:hypothetical protein